MFQNHGSSSENVLTKGCYVFGPLAIDDVRPTHQSQLATPPEAQFCDRSNPGSVRKIHSRQPGLDENDLKRVRAGLGFVYVCDRSHPGSVTNPLS